MPRGQRLALGRAHPRTFDPLSRSDLLLWLLPSPAKVTLASGKVQAIADSSNAGIYTSASQGTPADQPVYTAADAGYNGFPTVTFASANTTFLTTATTSLSGPATIYIVCEYDGAASTQEQMIEGGDSTNRWFYYKAATNNWTFGTSGTGNLLNGNAANGKQVHCIAVNGASSALYQNNSQTPVSTTTLAGSTDGFTLGRFAGGSNYIDAKMAEFLVFNTAHDGPTRSLIFNYLSRFGISVS